MRQRVTEARMKEHERNAKLWQPLPKNFAKRLIREVTETGNNKNVNRKEVYHLSNTWKSLPRKNVMLSGAAILQLTALGA